jgi:putative ATPase
MKTNIPLADRLRPTNINEVAGQHHLIDEGKVLRRIVDSGRVPNLIFYGPSGVGKTTVANIIATNSGKKLHYLNATTASTSDIKDIVKEIDDEDHNGILLYLDEIQYFNKKQQQILLSYIENGDITLIAATTENPYFYVYPAILSRSTAFEFKPLTTLDIKEVVDRALSVLEDEYNKRIDIDITSKISIAQSAAGDVRKALNMLELAVITSKADDTTITITNESVEEILQSNGVRYDRDGEQHYDIISAYQKSMRGSDPDAALYYLGRLLAAGDLPSACRRLLVCANEDVGLAYPQIIPIVKSAVDTALMVGLPEARLPLANAVVLVATSPKSNSAHDAINAVMADIENGLIGEIPSHLQNKHYDGAGAVIRGQNYKYPHEYPNHYVEQQYLPNIDQGKQYYKYGQNKFEQQSADYWKKIKKK